MPHQHLREMPSVAWPTLIERARCGDDDALGEIVRQTRDYLLAVAESRVGPVVQSKFGASDIVQQSMLEATQRIGTFRGATEAELRGWMKRIVLHNLTDAARQFTSTQSRDTSREFSINGQKRDGGLTCPSSKTGSWFLSRRELDFNLMQAVGRLPARQRHVVEGRHRDGQSYEEIGLQLGITASAARNLWTRAMHNLREMLNCEDDERAITRERPGLPR